jgi:hypothetical protein
MTDGGVEGGWGVGMPITFAPRRGAHGDLAGSGAPGGVIPPLALLGHPEGPKTSHAQAPGGIGVFVSSAVRGNGGNQERPLRPLACRAH